MKKLILIFIGVLFSCGIFAQGGNTYTYPFTIGKAGTSGGQITLNGLTSGSTVLSTPATGGTLLLNGSLGSSGTPVTKGWFTDIDVTNGVNAGTLYSKLVPDTVQHTANYTVAASDWAKDQHLNKATSILVTIPPDLGDWPVGGVINFYSFGAGITVMKAGAGVTLVSPLDSIATSQGKQDLSVKKIATNKYKLTGPLTD